VHHCNLADLRAGLPKVGASPTRDEITQAVKNLWTGDPWQYTEITVRVLGEVETIRAWNEEADP
jgi:hypothetical protein